MFLSYYYFPLYSKANFIVATFQQDIIVQLNSTYCSKDIEKIRESKFIVLLVLNTENITFTS